MEPSEYVAVLRKHWVVIVVVAVLGFAGGFAYSKTLPPSYRATASVYVSLPQGESVSELVQGSTYAGNTVPSLANLARQPVVLNPVIDQLELSTTATSLAKSVTVESPLNTTVLEIAAVSGNAQRSADIANAVAEQLPKTVTALGGWSADTRPAIQIRTVGAAVPPSYAFSPNTKLNAATGGALGAVLAVVFVLARSVLDTRVRSIKDVRRVTDAAVLSLIRYEKHDTADRLVVRDKPHSDRAEAFRRLRTNLRFLNLRGSSRAIVVTSSLPTEGKSVTTINLAIAMAEGSARILLIDADLRRPSIARYLGIEGAVGLTTVLIGDASLDEVVQPWGEGNLDVLAAGQVPPNPSELLDSPAMADLLALAATRYDVVLLDSAPLLPVTDAAILARVTDGALVVVGCRTVHRNHVAEGLGALSAVGARVLGLVLNQVSAKESGAAYVYGSTPSATATATHGVRAATPAGAVPVVTGAYAVVDPTTGATSALVVEPAPVPGVPVVTAAGPAPAGAPGATAAEPGRPDAGRASVPDGVPTLTRPVRAVREAPRFPEFLRGLDVPPPPESLSVAWAPFRSGSPAAETTTDAGATTHGVPAATTAPAPAEPTPQATESAASPDASATPGADDPADLVSDASDAQPARR
jgi:capsular exopolysaccharide synthesis family protein